MSNEEAVAYYLKKHPELKGIFALNETSTSWGFRCWMNWTIPMKFRL